MLIVSLWMIFSSSELDDDLLGEDLLAGKKVNK